MLDGSDLSNSYGSYKISDTTTGCSERPPLQNLGLAFSEDDSLVFVANPDQDRVNVIRTDNHAMEALVELPAGCDPHDVDVVGGMAYVVCRGLHSIETIDAVTLQLNTQNAIDLTWQTDSGQTPVAVATRSDGKFLFTANSSHRTLSVASLTSNTTVAQLYTGVNPARLLLLRLPQP
jgi:DNA-binding beta-propeller fold protein YncE